MFQKKKKGFIFWKKKHLPSVEQELIVVENLHVWYIRDLLHELTTLYEAKPCEIKL